MGLVISRGTNFHERCTSGLNRNFHDSEIHNPVLMLPTSRKVSQRCQHIPDA